MLISFSVFDVLYRNALQQELQLLVADGDMPFTAGNGRQFVGAFFQPFVIHRKAIALPQQQLYLVAFFVEKNKDAAAQRR